MFFLFFILNFSFANSSYIDKDDAIAFIGRTASVCGKVHYVLSPDSERRPYIIYFERYNGKFSKKNYSFNGIIWSSSISDIEISPKADLPGKNICISGVVSSYNQIPQIVISSPNQLQFIKEDLIGAK